jgi:hypothetical protein
MGRTLPRVTLWMEEGSGAFNSWDDSLELGRRADGSYSLRLRRRGKDEPYLMTLYRSRPFRTPERLVDEIQRRLPEAVGGNLYRPFTAKDTLNILAELIDFDVKLAKAALHIVAKQLEQLPR